jgi:hypothetical protein
MPKVQFVICDSCFWCASTLADKAIIGKCPCCRADSVESIPIAAGEKYSFDYDIHGGITLEFV